MPQWMTTLGLVVLGVAGIVLALIEADHQALSTMFGFTGIATAVLGLLLPRLEGDVELSATGLKARLRQAQLLASDEGLTLEEKGDALSALVLDPPAAPVSPARDAPVFAPEEPGLPSMPAFSWPAPPPAGQLQLRHTPRDFEAHVRRAFEQAGWKVSRLRRRETPDFSATQGSRVLNVEVKAARHLSAADVARIHALRQDSVTGPEPWVLVVPEGALSSAAARLAEDAEGWQLLYVPISRPAAAA
jgi:hypothetical protein